MRVSITEVYPLSSLQVPTSTDGLMVNDLTDGGGGGGGGGSGVWNGGNMQSSSPHYSPEPNFQTPTNSLAVDMVRHIHTYIHTCTHTQIHTGFFSKRGKGGRLVPVHPLVHATTAKKGYSHPPVCIHISIHT